MIRIKINKLKEAEKKDLEHPAKKFSNITIEKNADLVSFSDKGDTIKFLKDKLHLKSTNPETIEKLVAAIEPFRGNRISGFVGGGYFSRVFKLENDHVVKIFSQAVDVADDVKMYKDAYDKLYSGKARPYTLPVFYFDEINDSEISDSTIYVVEMAEVIPFDKYIQNSGRDYIKTGNSVKVITHFFADYMPENWVQIKGKHQVDQVMSMFKKSTDERMKYFKSFGNLADASDSFQQDYMDVMNFTYLSEAETRQMIKTFLGLHQEGYTLSDIGPRNFGVSKASTPNNPTFYVFDK